MLCNFLSNILKKFRDSITPEKTQRLINSLSADISGVTNAKFLTAKHFLLLVRLNTLTGSRYVINILNKLGHCIPYKLACKIEASQVVPNSESSSILTVFWIDNFDTVVEQVQGGGSVNTTYMMAFQEMTPETKINDNKVQIQRTRKRKFVGSEFKLTHANINQRKILHLCD